MEANLSLFLLSKNQNERDDNFPSTRLAITNIKIVITKNAKVIQRVLTSKLLLK